jgi:hypothetical protein
MKFKPLQPPALRQAVSGCQDGLTQLGAGKVVRSGDAEGSMRHGACQLAPLVAA